MARSFKVPTFYKSERLVEIKQRRKDEDPKKKDLSPSLLDFGQVRFKVARHFGFCFGVENAIDIAYRAVEEHAANVDTAERNAPDERRVFLLSEMIHNPEVNADLLSRGVRFLMKTDGTRLVEFSSLHPTDIVIVPAFGTTLELQQELLALGIDPYYYDATCPFVQKVWKRAEELGRQGFSVIVHGKRTHEETRATFSHSKQNSPTLVLLNMEEARWVVDFILGKKSEDFLVDKLKAGMSEGFQPDRDLQKVGVVNQTTMLASETQAIADAIRTAMLERYGALTLSEHFADTRDTLCYATNENQGATKALIDSGCDLAIVVGGYNSSNTSHLVELAAEKVPTYYIQNAAEIIDRKIIRHFDLKTHEVTEKHDWLPVKEACPLDIAITSGASCPDRIVDEVIDKIRSFYTE